MLRSLWNKRAIAPRRLLLLTLALSLLGHWAIGYFVGTSLRLPDLEIEMQIPIDVELGLSEAIEAAPVEPSAAPESASSESTEDDPDQGADAGAARDASVDAGAEDAELADGGEEDAAVDAGPPVLADAGPPGARLPPGAQIALRVDMTRIRNSPVVEDVRALLAAVPDWKALLDGSGIDPVEQLDRLLIATPNLQRDKVVLAGRFLGGRAVVHEAVRQLASARGVGAKWKAQRGVQVAPWANADSTARVIALVGPSHFTISREEDLERVLAIAAARAKRSAVDVHPADALLSMEELEGISLEVDGAEQFIRRAKRGIPQKLRLSAIERDGRRVELRGRLVYADTAAASDALDFWQKARDSYARNALIGLLGLSSVLQEATLVQEEAELRVSLSLSVDQTRLILGYLRELLVPKGAPPPGP